MTKPTKGHETVQVTAYVRKDLKAALSARAAKAGRSERELLEEALEQHLKRAPSDPEEPAPKPA